MAIGQMPIDFWEGKKAPSKITNDSNAQSKVSAMLQGNLDTNYQKI